MVKGMSGSVIIVTPGDLTTNEGNERGREKSAAS